MRMKLVKFREKEVLGIITFLFILIVPIVINSVNLKEKELESSYSTEDEPNFIHAAATFSDFKYYKEITIDPTKVMGGSDLTNFPFLLVIYDTDLRTEVQADGDDIAFHNGLDWLDYEIELFNQDFNSTHACLVAWIKLPSLSTSVDTTIYMYYGNPTMESQQNPSGVWNTNYNAVWHLNTTVQGPNTLLDSTVNDNDGSNYQADDVSAYIVNGRDYDGSDDYSNMGSGSSIDDIFDGGATISAWIRPEGWGGGTYGRILDKASETGGTDGWVICLDGGVSPWYNQLLFYRDFSVSRGLWMSGDNTITLNQWQHIVITYDDTSTSNDPALYINGVDQSGKSGWEDVTPSGTASNDAAQSLYIGNFMGGVGAGSRGFNGIIDEVRVISGIKTSSWIQTEYNNQYDPNSFFSVSSAFIIDNTPPDIKITLPTINNLLGVSAPNFNVEINDSSNIDSRWYRLVNGTVTTINTTFTTNGSINQVRWNEMGNGTVTLQFFANDSLGNIGFSEVTVRKDIYYPTIVINSPNHFELFGSTPPNFNIETWDINNVDDMWYTLNNSKETFFTTNGTISPSIWNTIGNGTVSIKFFANDSLSNTGFSEVIVRKEISAPTIYIISPDNYDLFGKTSPNFNVEIGDDNGVDDMWYTLNNGIETYFTDNGTISQSLWTTCGNGTVSIKFYANNSLGNGAFSEVIVRKDVISPVITINDPDNSDLCGKTAPSFNVLINDPNGVESKWYTLNGGITNTTFTSNGIINQTRWNEMDNGTIIIRFYANDSLGNLGSAEVYVYKDIIAPNITINFPTLYQLFGAVAPNFNIEITDINGINTQWYNLNGGDNITCGMTGQISSTQWTSLPNGTVTIKFFAKDSLGNEGFSEVMVRKDIENPIITINTPNDFELFAYDPPTYNVEIWESNTINSTWYTLNNGLKTFFSSNGTISGTRWATYGSGSISIKFYANDSLGNEGFSEVIVEKDISAPIITIDTPNNYALFGYNAPAYSVRILDSHVIHTMWYTLNNSLKTYFSSNGTISGIIWAGYGSGSISIKFYANDSLGNEGFSEVIVQKDIDSPIININSPISYELFGLIAPNFNIVITDSSSITSRWYTLDDGITNITCGTTGQVNQVLWNFQANGTVTIKFFAIDSLGNEGFSEVIIRKDIDPPSIIIVNPTLNQCFGETSPNFNVEITDINGIDTMWYSLDGGYTKTIFTTNESINQVIWDTFGDGNINIRFYANNSIGTTGFSEINVIKDMYAPSITLNSPNNNTYWNCAPIINIHSYDINFDTLWITIGSTNISISSDVNFQLNSSIWNSLPQGPFQIFINANDTLGHINSIMVNFHKDTINPNAPVLIIFPDGEVSIPIIFDWEDGTDSSGISYYRLIIDNEANPFATSGFIFEVNITNIGATSSYYELTQFLSPRNYYYFIYCVDGAGNQGVASSGTFIIAGSTEPPAEFPWWIILIIALPLGLIIAVIAARKSKKVKVVVIDKEVEMLKEQKKQLEMKARSALKAGNYQDAAELFSQCRYISNQLIENGIEEEKDKFRNFDKIEKELQLKIAAIPLAYTCINNVMTAYFDQLGIKYYSNPDIYPETQGNINGLILNDSKFLERRLADASVGEKLSNDLSLQPDQTSHINGIQFLYTNDLTEKSLIKMCYQYQNSQMLLLIVGIQWPSFEYDDLIAVPRDNSIKHKDNIRIINNDLLLRLIGIEGNNKDIFNKIIEANFDYNELNVLLKKIETQLHDTEELKYDLKKMEWFFFL